MVRLTTRDDVVMWSYAVSLKHFQTLVTIHQRQEHVKAIQPDLLFFPTMNLQRSSPGAKL